MKMNLAATIKARFGSQIAFARAVGLHPVRINRLCKGWIEPTRTERERIAEALETDADWLFAGFRIPAAEVRARGNSKRITARQHIEFASTIHSPWRGCE